MADPKEQAETQLRNIEAASGLTLADFTGKVAPAGLAKHGKIVAYLKAEHGHTWARRRDRRPEDGRELSKAEAVRARSGAVVEANPAWIEPC